MSRVLIQMLRATAFVLMQEMHPDQAWFWTPEWQAGEREADADYAAGRTTMQENTEDFIAAMKARRPDLANA